MITTVFKSGLPVDTAGDYLGSSPAPAPQTFAVSMNFYGSSTTTGPFETLVTRQIWVADAPTQVVAVTERHSIVGSVTGMLVKAINGSTLTSGLNVLASTIDHTAAVDTARYGTLINSTTVTQLAQGDALGWRFSAANPICAGSITVTLARI